jgi:hypothetical protein
MYKSALVGHREHSRLLFADKVHQGLNRANRRALRKLLQSLATSKCPFANLPTTNGGRPPGPGRWGEGVTPDGMGRLHLAPPRNRSRNQIRRVAGVLRHAEFVTLREA